MGEVSPDSCFMTMS